jgi:hypothetical protein
MQWGTKMLSTEERYMYITYIYIHVDMDRLNSFYPIGLILDIQGLQSPTSWTRPLFTLGLKSSQFCSRSLFLLLSILPLHRSSQNM